MANSTSASLKLTVQTTGENSGTWGAFTNSNLLVLEQAIGGYAGIALNATTGATLTFSNGVVSNGKNQVIKLTGTITTNVNVIIPNSIEKTYIVENATSGAHTVTVKTTSGSGFTFGTTEKTRAIVYSDGTNVVEVINNTQNLLDLADVANTNGNFIVGDGSNLVVESGATARDSIGLGITNDVEFNDGKLDSLGIGTAASGTTGEIRATNDITAFFSSDVALKENIVNIPNPLESLKKLNGVLFDWKKDYIDGRGGEDGYFVRKKDVGVIAQEVEKVLPEAVAQRSDGVKAVKYDRLTCLLIEAVKKLNDKVDTLTKEKK
tara:strand:- start:4866 stop:5828 length:963 start_codon:yes stop_codon:yes gene_type:complete